MEAKTINQRINELPRELNMNWYQIANRVGVYRSQMTRFKNSESMRLSMLEKYAKALGYIPLAFFVESTLEIEDLGIEDFFDGVKVNNYVGKVFKKHRELAGLSQSELIREIGFEAQQYRSRYSRIENGVLKPSTKAIEEISKVLTLVPLYFLKIR